MPLIAAPETSLGIDGVARLDALGPILEVVVLVRAAVRRFTGVWVARSSEVVDAWHMDETFVRIAGRLASASNTSQAHRVGKFCKPFVQPHPTMHLCIRTFVMQA